MSEKNLLNMWPHDYLKSLDDIFVQDPRSGIMCEFPKNIEQHYDLISQIKLSQKVWPEYSVKFETAKNTFLYSWFVYRLANVSMLEVFATLELVLRVVAETQGYKIKNLCPLLEKAKKECWVNFNDFVGDVDVSDYIEKIRLTRNKHSHGTVEVLTPDMVISCFQDSANMINQVFDSDLLINKGKSVRDGWC